MALQGFGDVKTQQSPKVSEPDVRKELAVTKTSKSTTSTKKSVNSLKKKSEPLTGIYRDIPSNVMRAIRQEFPDATNHTDALMAYLACHGKGLVAERANTSLTSTQHELVDGWSGDSYESLMNEVKKLVTMCKSMSKMTEVVELLATYMVYDRLGFRNENPMIPKDANLREDGVLELLLSAEEQVVGFQKDKEYKQGRPFRG